MPKKPPKKLLVKRALDISLYDGGSSFAIRRQLKADAVAKARTPKQNLEAALKAADLHFISTGEDEGKAAYDVSTALMAMRDTIGTTPENLLAAQRQLRRLQDEHTLKVVAHEHARLTYVAAKEALADFGSPYCGGMLAWNQISGLLVTDSKGQYSWQCPKCRTHGLTKKRPKPGQTCKEPK